MVRTINEGSCILCPVVTNNYDALVGRLCPTCSVEHAVKCIPVNDASDAILIEEAKKQPLVDHSHDIDAFLRK